MTGCCRDQVSNTPGCRQAELMPHGCTIVDQSLQPGIVYFCQALYLLIQALFGFKSKCDGIQLKRGVDIENSQFFSPQIKLSPMCCNKVEYRDDRLHCLAEYLNLDKIFFQYRFPYIDHIQQHITA